MAPNSRDFLTDRVAAERDDPLGPQPPGRQDAGEADGTVADHGDRTARPHVGAHGGVVTGRHDVGERQQRGEHLFRVPGPGHRDERAVGQRYAHRLALAAVTVGRVEAAGDAGGGDAVAAVRAGTVAERERRDDEDAALDVRDVAADVLDHADELVADRAGLERRVAAVVPEVRPADAGEYDADDRVGRLGDDRVAPVADLDTVRFDEESCTHGLQQSALSPVVGGPAKGVPAGHPCDAARALPS